MKINKMGMHGQVMLAEREAVAKLEKTDMLFSSTLLKAEDDQYQERLGKLLEKIEEQGKQLAETPTYSELKNYRELVRAFLGEAVGRMYSLESQAGWDRQGRHKVFTTVKQIDRKLVELAEDVRTGQGRQLAIIDKLGAIRGLLVDLYM